MTQEEINKFPSKASPKDKLSAIIKHYEEKGYEVETTQRSFRDDFKISIPGNRAKITGDCDSLGKFSINYSGNKYKILKTIIKKIDGEIRYQKRIVDNNKRANILLDVFILTLNYSGLDKKYTREDFFSPSLTNIYEIVKYKGTTITVKLNEDYTSSFTIYTTNADDAINAAEFINIFKEKLIVTQL